ncbi:large conductance mechanosensitive channel protein MscL [Anaeromyxobacter sp. Fw109-5]|uniref:large conductance mechanosensitive channel protein MscL n=1 Tax=Anaeromyxobacter sp. (strain Fw109-5) TaxID=404589 RepID=UPI0000ED8B83|nr:large conductance mechanosensitive channel protein MscL [Anaeromyxobacter sp. Fw109-5]ABS26241.1 large conductance mechanosensitive channel protein [Anaeromyxobacter sp. Fw109-5]
MVNGLEATRRAGGLAKEFREFLLKQNVIALAAGVVIGAAIGKVVSGIVDFVVMPVVGLLLPGQDEWRQAKLDIGGGNAIGYGEVVGRLVEFGIIALVVFLVLKAFVRAPPPPAPTKACPQCLETIPAAALRCRACTSEV